MTTKSVTNNTGLIFNSLFLVRYRTVPYDERWTFGSYFALSGTCIIDEVLYLTAINEGCMAQSFHLDNMPNVPHAQFQFGLSPHTLCSWHTCGWVRVQYYYDILDRIYFSEIHFCKLQWGFSGYQTNVPVNLRLVLEGGRFSPEVSGTTSQYNFPV
jgi:hypothetical protein